VVGPLPPAAALAAYLRQPRPRRDRLRQDPRVDVLKRRAGFGVPEEHLGVAPGRHEVRSRRPPHLVERHPFPAEPGVVEDLVEPVVQARQGHRPPQHLGPPGGPGREQLGHAALGEEVHLGFPLALSGVGVDRQAAVRQVGPLGGEQGPDSLPGLPGERQEGREPDRGRDRPDRATGLTGRLGRRGPSVPAPPCGGRLAPPGSPNTVRG